MALWRKGAARREYGRNGTARAEAGEREMRNYAERNVAQIATARVGGELMGAGESGRSDIERGKTNGRKGGKEIKERERERERERDEIDRPDRR